MPAPLTTAAPSPISRKEMRPVKYHYADTFWCTYIISVISANIAELGETHRKIHLNTFTSLIFSVQIDSMMINYDCPISATYPLDLTKTRLQIQGEGNKLKGNGIEAAKKVRIRLLS